MKVDQIMRAHLATVGLDDPLSLVKEIFDNAPFHHLLVVEDRKLYGVISDRDLLKAISPNIGTPRFTSQDMATLKKRVHQIVTRHPITLPAGASIADALVIFNASQVSCIPIVDDDNIAIGLLSWRDILRNFEQICAERSPG